MPYRAALIWNISLLLSPGHTLGVCGWVALRSPAVLSAGEGLREEDAG